MENVLKLNNLYSELIRATDLAKEHYLKTQKFIPTTISWSQDDDERCFLMLPDIGDRVSGGRENSIKTARVFNAIFNTKRYVLITEAYMLKASSDSEYQKYVGNVSEHPDKIECLVIMACEKDRTLATILEVKEDRTLKDHTQTDSLKGDFTELHNWDFIIGSKEVRKELLKHFYNLSQVHNLKGNKDDQSTTREQ